MATGNKNIDSLVDLIYGISQSAEVGSLRDEQSVQLEKLLSLATGAAPRIYKALLTQTGTNAPTADIIINTFGVTPTWSRLNPGSYEVVIPGAFPDATKVIISQGARFSDYYIGAEVLDVNTVAINVIDVSDSSDYDDGLELTPFTIEVYP